MEYKQIKVKQLPLSDIENVNRLIMHSDVLEAIETVIQHETEFGKLIIVGVQRDSGELFIQTAGLSQFEAMGLLEVAKLEISASNYEELSGED